MDADLATLAPIVLYGIGVLLLSLTMVWDLYLSFLPHLWVILAALAWLGVSWTALGAILAPHFLFLALRLARAALADPPGPPAP